MNKLFNESLKALDDLITSLRLETKEENKKYIVMDRDIEKIWSFNSKQMMQDFLDIYLCEEELQYITSYNNGKVIVIKEVL